MEFSKLLKERNYSMVHSTPQTKQKKRKCDLLRACGVEVKLEPGKLFVKYPDGEFRNIWDDTGVIDFYFKDDNAMAKWRAFYHKINPASSEKKVGDKKISRYTASDFLLLSNLESILPLEMTYDEFIQDLASDVRVHFNK
jgi:hypothetical protein